MNKENRIIKDVARFENDVYRISAWTGKEGASFLDVRVYFKKNGKLKKTEEGMNILSSLRAEIADALIQAKNAPELPLPAEGKKFESALVTTVSISETAQYQISKVRGPKNCSVRISYAFKGDNGDFIPSGKKAISILESSVDALAEVLLSPEAAPVQTEAATQAV